MSGSLPPSPSPNPPPTNISLPPTSTNSRTYRITENTSNIPIEEHSRLASEQPVASTSTASPSQTFHQTPQSGIKRPGSRDFEDESPTMAKRLRISVVKEEASQEQMRMSPSSDSQDTENNQSSAKGKRPEQQTETAPVKKKRTRTLTTPHQAAVLHALLAQSRFPTTAMREEVGRSIGLSARKVQIWFQNQRQKARRPRKEPDESTPLPPRYGPFPAFPPQAHPGSLPMIPGPSPPPNPQLLPMTYNAPVQQPYGRPQHPTEASGRCSQSAEPQGRLLGPGVPGADLHGSSYHGQVRGTAQSQDVNTPGGSTYSAGSPTQVYSPRFSLRLPIPGHVAPTTSAYDQNFNRTLPPLAFDSTHPPPRGANVSRGSQLQSPPITLPPPEPSHLRPRSSASPRASQFVPQSPEVHGHSRVVLPPPFTLQPEPHWDESSFSASLRPAAFTRSRTGSQTTRGSSASPVTYVRESSAVVVDNPSVSESTLGPEPSTPAPAARVPPAPSIRSGRYDPVRATFVPYSTPSSSSTPGPDSQRDRNDDPDSGQTPFRKES